MKHLETARKRIVSFVPTGDDFPRHHFDQQIPRSAAECYRQNLETINSRQAGKSLQLCMDKLKR